MDKNILEFPVTIYGNLEPYNDVLSKARCRIFYKYGNRNGTFITDEFANELIQTLPYTPVKGIYESSSEEEDYTDHGIKRSEGRIYGIVPETTNFAWERHVDNDNIERVYACTDVLLFTALYSEASEIVGKSQSMELYEPSLKYHWAIINGKKYVVFDKGCFLGLQVLGDKVEPCFEGASFYSLQNSIEDIIMKIKQYSKGGQLQVDKINFKLSDNEKHDALWNLLNERFNEENNWEVDYAICSIYDDYAIAFNYTDGSYERIYYVKDDESDTVVINQCKKCYIIDVTEEEKATLDTLRKLNGDTYELVCENLTNADANATTCEEYGAKIEELNAALSTLQQEINDKQNEFDAVTTKYTEDQAALTAELENLRNYKYAVESNEKERVLAEYADKLSNEIIENYRGSKDNYTIIELDKELAYELKKAGISAFSAQTPGYTPKDDALNGIEAILSRYKK